METHSHPKVEPLRRIIGLLFLAATVAAVLSAVVSSGAVNQPGSPEQAAALRKIAPWVTQHTAGGKQAEFMIILTDQADVSGAAFMQTKAAKGPAGYPQPVPRRNATPARARLHSDFLPRSR